MKLPNNTFLIIFIHLALWVFLLILPVFSTAPLFFSQRVEVAQRFYLMFAYSSVLLLIIFYANYFFLFPRFYLNGKKSIYFLIAFLVIFIVVNLNRVTKVYFQIQSEPFDKLKFMFIAFAIFRILLAFFLSSALVVYERWQKSEKERLVAEVSFLKAQINPHFLFNTLNGIYTLVLKKSDKAADSISKLSSIMQYVTTDATKEKVLLENEINYITNYIELQKLRLTNSTRVVFTIEGNPSALQIEPLLLIAFIENAFKYGVSTERESNIQISMTITEGEFRLFVQNQKLQRNIQENKNTGIGLENTISRLQKGYLNLHKLNIDFDNQYYTVNLFLQLK